MATTQTIPSGIEWPPCPRCNSPEFVHRAGLHARLQFPSAQKYECSRCGKGKKFLASSEQKYSPGRVKQLGPPTPVPILTVSQCETIRELNPSMRPIEIAGKVRCSESSVRRVLKQLGLPPCKTQTAEQANGFLRIKISKAMAEMSALRGVSIAAYLFQLADADRAEVRRKDFPQHGFVKEPVAPIVATEYRAVKICPLTIQKILFQLDEGLPVPQIAERFAVSRSSIRRIQEERTQSAGQVKSLSAARTHRGAEILLGKQQ